MFSIYKLVTYALPINRERSGRQNDCFNPHFSIFKNLFKAYGHLIEQQTYELALISNSPNQHELSITTCKDTAKATTI